MKIKRLTSLAAAAALVLGLGTPAFAANPIESLGGTDSAEVKATYQAGGTSATVYNVSIEWDSLEFTYTAAADGTWDPTTHSYSGGGQASWSGSKNIVVTNHSNAAVVATASFQADSGYEDVTMTFGNNEQTLQTAEGTAVASAPSATITVTPGGTLPESANGGKIGSVTLTITAGA